jgi:hypothetical protein
MKAKENLKEMYILLGLISQRHEQLRGVSSASRDFVVC